MANKPVPASARTGGFNNGRPMPPTEVVPIVRFAPALLRLGYTTQEDITKLANQYNKKMKGQVFAMPEHRHRVMKVFSVDCEIRMRVTVEPLAEVELPETEKQEVAL